MDNPQYFEWEFFRALDAAEEAPAGFVPLRRRYASFWRRLLAHIIDGFILWAVTYALAMVLGVVSIMMLGPSLGVGTDLGKGAALGAITMFIDYFIPFVYYVAFWIAKGQTPGKMVVKVRVTREDGSRIGWGRAFLRYIGYFICGLTLGIGFLVIFWSHKRQGLHDMIAGTVVMLEGGEAASAAQDAPVDTL